MRKYYTREEDEEIIRCVNDYPTNISHAMSVAAEKLGRGTTAVTSRYYIIKKNPDIKAVTCGSNKGFSQNVKNLARDKEGNMPEQGLKHYMWLMKEFLSLAPKERQVFVEFLQLSLE